MTAAVLAEHTGAAADVLRAGGWEVLVAGSSAELEAAVRDGRASACLDLLLTDLLADPDRLTAASRAGLPQVVGAGGLPADLTPEAADRLGLEVAQRVSASRGRAAVLVPRVPATPAAAVFAESLRNWAYGFEVAECDHPADSPAFAAAAAGLLVRLG